MPIKVAHVVRQYYPSIGGMEDVVKNIARQQQLCHRQIASIVTLNRLFKNSVGILEPNALIDGVDVVRLSYGGSNRYPLCPQVLKHISESDLIHVHGIDFFFDYLALTKSIHRKPLVASTHGGFFHTPFLSSAKKVFFKTVTRASSGAYDKIIATSNNDGDLFSEIVPASKLVVIENGVNTQKYRNLAATICTPTIIYFGRWSQNKGITTALSLFSQLASSHPDWKMIIAGREYDLGLDDLHALVTRYRLSHAVQIVANPSDKDLASLIGSASYFICLSRHEGFGIAAVEAMSAGLTPILSDIPPFRQLLDQSGNGLLVEDNNPKLVIEKLLALHSQSQTEYYQRRQDLQRFSLRYDWKPIAEQYVDIYTELVNTPCKKHESMQ